MNKAIKPIIGRSNDKFKSNETRHTTSRADITPLLLIFISFLLLGIMFGSKGIAATRRTFTPRISIQDRYDKQVDFYTDSNKIYRITSADRITLVSPGLALVMDTPTTRMNLDYAANFAFYRDDSSKDNIRHQGTALWDQQLNPKLRLNLSDTFITAEDRLLVSERQEEDIFTRRRIYYLNNGQANLSWQFGKENLMSLGYRNRYLEDKSNLYEDSVNHEGSLNLETWFHPKFGVGLTSRISRGEFKQAEEFTGVGTKDFNEYEGEVRLNYRWHPTKRLYARYNLLGKDFEELDQGANTVDFWVHQSALGFSLALSPSTDFSADGGYFVQDYVNGRENDGGTFNTNLNTRRKKASFNLRAGGGFSQDYFSSDNFGSSEFRETSGAADYQFNENLSGAATLSCRFDEFFGGDNQMDRKEDVWQAGTGLSFSFWKQSTLSINGSYLERDTTEVDSYHRDEEVWRADAGLSFSFWKQSTLSINGSYWEKDTTQTGGDSYYRDDNVWRLHAGFSLPFWQWLTLSMGGSYSENDSTDPTHEFRDYSVMFRITGAYPVLF